MLTLTNRRSPQSIDDLDAVGCKQLEICGQRWDGEALPAVERLFPTDHEIETNFYTQMLARWDVIERGVHAYDAWFFAVDSGVFFRAGSTEVVCVVVQFDFQSDAGDRVLAGALADAAKRAQAI